MTQREFIKQLKAALEEGNVSSRIVNDNVEYYNNYITEQLAAGRTIDDIINGLGSPRLIAKTIIEASNGAGADSSSDSSGPSHTFIWIRNSMKDYGWVWKLVGFLLVATIILLILKGIFAIIGFLFKPAVVVLACVAVYYVVVNIKNNK